MSTIYHCYARSAVSPSIRSTDSSCSTLDHWSSTVSTHRALTSARSRSVARDQASCQSIVDFTLDADDNILALSPFGPSVVDIPRRLEPGNNAQRTDRPGIGPSTGFSIGTHEIHRVLVWSFGSMGDKQAVMLMSTPRSATGDGADLAAGR